MMWVLGLLIFLDLTYPVIAWVGNGLRSPLKVAPPSHRARTIFSSADKDEENEPSNPYADPNYPDLEFINYDDPNYTSGQENDEFLDSSSTDEAVEAMREERRRKNDEYQFETYHANCLKSGEKFKGEWTVYRTSTFLKSTGEEESDIPRFKKENHVRKVISSGNKIKLNSPPESFEMRVDGERLVHEERLAESYDFEDSDEWDEVVADGLLASDDDDIDEHMVGRRYWPEQMSSWDFRGPPGAMCVGNAYTICDGIPIQADDADNFEGPFSELRNEIGIYYRRMRFRVKWDYRINRSNETGHGATPPLLLYSMIVCRETRERWPRYLTETNLDETISEKLFGTPGAAGGLYDPPPVGSQQQASLYMSLDLDGGATVLFPYRIDQDINAHNGNGWVQSLDWSPGRLRYQADRKFHGGKNIRGLRSLELSEVQAQDAQQWRPNDDGSDMRQ